MYIVEEAVVKKTELFKNKVEIKGNKGFKDPAFWKLMKKVGFQVDDPWCAYYVELVWTEVYRDLGANIVVERLTKLFSPSAVQTYKNFKKAGYPIGSVPKIGALVVWQTYNHGVKHWTGHIGIVIDCVDGYFKTSEGNTSKYPGDRDGGSVANKEYFNYKSMFNVYDGLRLKGFVYLDDYVMNDNDKKTSAYGY